MFTVNIILLVFFIIKTIIKLKIGGEELRFSIKCLIISAMGVIYFFIMAKISGLIMVYDNGSFYINNEEVSSAIIVVMTVIYFVIVSYPLIDMAKRKRASLIKKAGK